MLAARTGTGAKLLLGVLVVDILFPALHQQFPVLQKVVVVLQKQGLVAVVGVGSIHSGGGAVVFRQAEHAEERTRRSAAHHCTVCVVKIYRNK